MSLSTGSRLGSYEIVAALGAGGMGEVYRARDTKLGRDVAIKILPELFVADPDRVARFQREAQILAALNHPNIAAIYGLEDAGSTHFIVMELVDGESLAARLKARAPSATDGARGLSRASGLDVPEALAIARQIVDALETAHDKGIVHRDLKPANIMLTTDGQVKVLDFGLAKHDPGGAGEAGKAGAEAAGALTHSPTLTFAATQAGMILGTAAYMSPEQARGRAADKRSDVWAFGCVLYEMLAGRRAFDPSTGSESSRAESRDEGPDVTDIIAAIVRGEPDWSAVPPDVTPGIRALLKRCLEKDRKLRIPDMSVVRFLMADAEKAAPIAAAAPTTLAARRRVAIAIGGGIAGAAIAAAATWAIMRPRPALPLRPVRVAIVLPASRPIISGTPDRVIVITPDASHLAYVSGANLGGGGQLMVRAMTELESVPIRGVTAARAPFVSADSRWLGYFDSGELKKVPMSGGPPITICRVVGGTRGSSWGADDMIVYATNDATTGLFSVPAGGGEAKLLTKPDTAQGEVDHLFPSILPGARAVLFTITMTGPVDNARIAALDLKTGQRKTLIRGGSHAEYVATGHLVYASGGALRAVRFDPERLEVLSDPVVVVDEVRTETTGAAQFSVSQNGSLLYLTGGGGSFGERSLVWVDRRGREQAIDAPPRAYTYPRISADGTRLAVSLADQDQDIWVMDIARQPLTRLTFEPSIEQLPVWAPDGQRIFFSSGRDGIPNVFWKRADGTGPIEPVTHAQTLVYPYSISPDGKMLVVGTNGAADLGLIRLDQPSKILPLIEETSTQSNAEVSPDGRWLAYQSAESGQFQIYVRPFPNVQAGRWQISSNGGVRPLWSRNGQELFYDAGRDGSLVAVPVRSNPTFSFGNPTKLFDGRYYPGPAGRTYDVSRDGQRFLMIKEAQRSDREATINFVLVINWFEELRQRLVPK